MIKYRLGDTVDVISEREENPANCKYDKFVGLEHYISGEVEIKSYGSTDLLKSAMKIFKAGDILVARRNVYLRRASVVNFDGITSGDSIVLRAKDELIKKLLPFVLNTDNFWEYAEKFSDGTMSKRLSPKILLQYEFNLPDIKEQKNLAELLWAANDTKEAYKKLLSKSDDILKARFMEMFGEEKDFKKVPISNVVDNKIEKAKIKFNDSTFIKYIDISSIDNKRNIVTGFTKHIMKDAPSRAQQILNYGDILVSTVRPNLRNFAINPYDDKNVVGTSGFCVLRSKTCRPEYLWGVVFSDEFTNTMISQTSGANYPAIRNKDIMNYLIPIPPDELQQEFAEFMHQVNKSKAEIEETIASLDKTIKALLKKTLG